MNVCPAQPGTPASILPLLSPDVAQPLSGLSERPASSASSGEMKASRSYAVGVGEASSSLSLELSEAGAQSQKPVGWIGWVEAWLNLVRQPSPQPCTATQWLGPVTTNSSAP